MFNKEIVTCEGVGPGLGLLSQATRVGNLAEVTSTACIPS